MLVMRPYQQDMIDQTYAEWAKGSRFVVLVAPTGSGKASVLCEVARLEAERGQIVVITAHRRELITQLSSTLARNGLQHSIIASRSTVKYANRLHMETLGKSFYNSNSRVIVGSVQSIKSQFIAHLAMYGDKVTAIGDEGHHYTRDSLTWGKVFSPLDDAGCRGLLLTATPCRADGRGLSRETDGYGDVLVNGPTMRWCIGQGYLSDYRIYCPPSDLQLDRVKVSKSTGEYAEKELKDEISQSHIVGDIVEHYLKIAPGKRGVTFTVGVDMAEEVAAQYRARGVPAVAMSGRMKDSERVQALRDLRSGKILQVVNDSVLTEGTDEPSIEVVSFARPTQSFGLYCQMFGRATRPSPDTGKTHAIIIDAVGNVHRHGLPDAIREWSLDRREKRSSGKSDAEAVRTCQACTAVYERFMTACPFCGEPIPKPAERSGPQFVDGDLFELDAATLAQMRTAVEQVDMPADEYRKTLEAKFMPHLGILAALKRHKGRQESVGILRDLMAHWAGWERHRGLTDSEIYRKFYLTFGSDMMTAQTLKRDDMLTLGERIKADMERNNESC